MKKSLLFMAFLFILGGLCVNAAETTLNFTGWNFEGAEPAWGNSYSSHTATFDEATVTFSKAAKQTSTVKDCPVMKTGTITVVFNDVTVSHVKFNLKQWGTKTKTAKLATSVDGTNFSDTGISSSSFVLESDLSSDIKAVQVSFTEANNQVGLSSIVLTDDNSEPTPPAEPVAYEPNFADVELWEGETAALNLGNKYPTDIIFVSENESVATVSDEGVITAVGAGETTVSVTWDADENFLASTDPVTFKVVVKALPEGSQFESITGANFADISGNTYASYFVSTDFADYTVITTDANLPNITWNRGNKNVGKNSGIVFKAKDGYYPIWVTVESNWNNSQDMNLYLSNDELTLAGLGAATTAGVITKEASTYVINGEYKYIGICPSADKQIQLIKLTILWGKADVPAIEFPSFGEAEHSFTTESSEIRIADADHAFDIFYLHTPAQGNPEAYAEGETADSFDNKAEFDEANCQHVIPVSESGTLSYYAVHTATGTQGATQTVKVTKTATTAIDAIGTDAAEGEAEYFDIRGVKVNIDNAAPGLYIRRQGVTATKVIVK